MAENGVIKTGYFFKQGTRMIVVQIETACKSLPFGNSR